VNGGRPEVNGSWIWRTFRLGRDGGGLFGSQVLVGGFAMHAGLSERDGELDSGMRQWVAERLFVRC